MKEYNLQKWNDGALYPEDYRYKYPKAGESNSKIEIHIYSLNDKQKTRVDIGKEADIYIPRIYWTKNPNLLSVQRLNRLQNQLDILHVNAGSGSSEIVLTDKSERYIDFTFCDDLLYLDNGNEFIFSSEKSGFKHFYRHKVDGSLINQITTGDYEALSLVGVDQSKKTPPSVLHLHRGFPSTKATLRHFCQRKREEKTLKIFWCDAYQYERRL